jgi:hypothetical protein
VGSKKVYIHEVYCQARTFISGASLSLSLSLTHVTHNFISETSSSTSSRVCTRSCLGVRVTRYGFGLRPDTPSDPSRDIGSSGSDRMSKAQSNRETASHSSRSATWMPAQMRRLRRVRIKCQRLNGRQPQAKQETLSYVPRTERPMVPIHPIGEVA